MKRSGCYHVMLCVMCMLLSSVKSKRSLETLRGLSHHWKAIGKEMGLNGVDMDTYRRTKDLRIGQHELSVTINSTSIIITNNGIIVYERHGPAVKHTKPGEGHSGVHVLILHEDEGHLMMAEQYQTYQPAEHERLVNVLKTIQPGRVTILAGVPEWVMFLSKRAETALANFGCRWASSATQGEVWACVGIMDVGVVAEAISTRYLENYPGPSLRLDVAISKTNRAEPRCPWYILPGLQRQASFCESYEGYSDLCSCQKPFFPEVRKLQPLITMKEKIPVVVVTANKPLHLFRLLHQLFTTPGIIQTDILVIVDGLHEETLRLIKVMQLRVLIHAPEGPRHFRTNANIKFALSSAFLVFPEIDKAIFLEDDLLISPDVLSFFHQTAPILDFDPTVYCVSSFSLNSFKDTASDPKVLMRARTYPKYGWMVNKKYAEETVQKWVPEGLGDWDYWLVWEDLRKGRDIVFPEVSRTFHAGSAGVHVTGFEQETYFNRMIYNKELDVKLNSIQSVIRQRYDELLSQDLRIARPVFPSRDLCNMTWVNPRNPEPIAVYVNAFDANDKFNSYKIFLTCCLTYDQSTQEIYKGVIRLRWHKTLIYLVGCPYSPFCDHKPKDLPIYRPTSEDLVRAGEFRDDWEVQFFHRNNRLGRRPSASLQEVFDLADIVSTGS